MGNIDFALTQRVRERVKARRLRSQGSFESGDRLADVGIGPVNVLPQFWGHRTPGQGEITFAVRHSMIRSGTKVGGGPEQRLVFFPVGRESEADEP